MADISKSVMGIVGLVVVIFMVATVAVPVIEDAETVAITGSNESRMLYQVDFTESGGSLDVVWSPGSIEIDGTTYNDIPDNRLYIVSDTFYVSLNSNLAIVVDSSGYTQTNASMTMTAANGEYSATVGETTKSGTFGGLMKPSVTGDFGMFIESFYVSKDTTAYLFRGGTTSAPWFMAEVVAGEQDGWFVGPNLFTTTSNAAYTGSVTIEAIEYPDMELADSVLLNQVNVTITPDGGSASTSQYSGIWFAPLEYVSGSKSSHTVLGVLIPLLFIVPVIMAVRMIGGRE